MCEAEPRQKPLSDFAIELYENAVDWPEDGNQIPEDKKHFYRLDKAPQVGEIRIVNVKYPFNQQIGEEFWTIFVPPMSYFNGWEEAPEEIFLSAVVKCRMEQVEEQYIKDGWIKVTILEVVFLQDIDKRFPSMKNCESSASMLAMCEDLFEYKCWKYYSWSCQGDVGGWCLVYVDEAGVNHLILANEWVMCDEHTYCGNVIILL